MRIKLKGRYAVVHLNNLRVKTIVFQLSDKSVSKFRMNSQWNHC